MKNTLLARKLVILISFGFICIWSNIANAQEVEIIPIEHASTLLLHGNTTIYIDPVGEAEWYANYPSPDLVLITDIHWDHFNPKTLGALIQEGTTIIAPQAVADKMTPALLAKTSILANGGVMNSNGINVEAIPMYNLREEALDFHTKGRGNGYVITIDQKRIYFSGDTEDIEEMRSLKNIDMAFVCMNLPYTMTENSAAAAVIAFSPKKVYPYHYRGKPNVSDVALFKTLIEKSNAKVEVIQLDWYPRDQF